MKLSRKIKFFFQRNVRGFDDTEVWNLDWYISSYTLPRLKRLKEMTQSHPVNLEYEEWLAVLDELIWLHSSDRFEEGFDYERYNRACELWGKHFKNLWY